VSPPGGPIEVDDPSTPVDVAVQATIDPPLGDPVDCRSPICALAFVRLDATGRVQIVVTDRLSFA
jgi:hypothetical protein